MMKNHTDLLNEIGRTCELARHFKVPSQTISKWKERGVPWRARHEIAMLAKEKEIELPEGFFTFDNED